MSEQPIPAPEPELSVSVIITTYNRREALLESLRALGKQTIAPERYELIVVDDGSTDDTFEMASRMSLPCALHSFRQAENCGISVARNLAIRQAHGRYLVFVGDDLIVPENFLATHVATLERFPGCWVVGGIKQLDSISETRFGCFLDQLEKSWEEARKASPIEPHLWEMSWPTARNLSLPAADLARTGLFDEQFRMSCEDQDLAHEARALGIRFLYNDQITCLHNDQVGDLHRFCRAQIPRTRDTALFCAKRPEHAQSPVARVNGFISRADNPRLVLKKIVKTTFAVSPVMLALERLIALAERSPVTDALLWPLYHFVIGLYMFRGWREGLAVLEQQEALTDVYRLGCHPNA